MMHENSAPAARSSRPPETRAEQSSANRHDADQKALRIARHTRVFEWCLEREAKALQWKAQQLSVERRPENQRARAERLELALRVGGPLCGHLISRTVGRVRDAGRYLL